MSRIAEGSLPTGKASPGVFSPVLHASKIFWLLTESDFWTFVIPDTLFGIFGALAGPVLTTNDGVRVTTVLFHLPRVLAWNWLNLAVFDLANQRSPDSVIEDKLNKPWRPVPTGHVTTAQMRGLLLGALPAVLAINYLMGAWEETSLLFSLTWMYNDLGGGEDSFILRNMIIGLAFALYNAGSLRVACGRGHALHRMGVCWVLITAGVILSTMHIQDLKDTAGDHARKRRSAPLILGDRVARWSIAVPVVAWSVLCPWYLELGLLAFVAPMTIGACIAIRTLFLRGVEADRMSWNIWAVWLISLYVLPMAKNQQNF